MDKKASFKIPTEASVFGPKFHGSLQTLKCFSSFVQLGSFSHVRFYFGCMTFQSIRCFYLQW